MWEWIVAVGVFVVLVLAMPWAMSGMRRSARTKGGDSIGGTMLELQSIIAPSTTHLIEAREEKVHERAGNDEPDDVDTLSR